MPENQVSTVMKFKLDLAEAERELAAFEQKHSRPLSNTGAGLATAPTSISGAQKQSIELTAKEAEIAEKLRDRLEKVAAAKKALGQEYTAETEKIKQLNRAIEASPLATNRELDKEAEGKQRRSDLAHLMGGFREESQRRTAARATEMESAQADAISAAAQKAAEERRKILSKPPPVIPPPESPDAVNGRGLQTMLSRFGGMGLTGTLAVYGAIGVALKKIVDLWLDFNGQVDKNIALMRDYETVNLRIDGMALRLQKVAQGNREFARAWREMEVSVHNVQTEASKLLETEENILTFQQRLDDAETRRAHAKNALQNRLNPIAEATEAQRIEEAAFHRKVAREKELEQIKLNNLKLQQDMAAGRGAEFAREAAGIKGSLPGLGAAADTAADELETTNRRTRLRDERLEKERAALVKIRGAREPATLGIGMAQYLSARKDVMAEGDQSLNSIDAAGINPAAMIAQIAGGGIDRRIAEIDKLFEGTKDQRTVAAAKARATGFEVKEAEGSLGFAKGEALQAGRTFKTTDMERQFLEQQIRDREGPRNAATQATTEAMQLDLQRQILQTLQSIRSDWTVPQ